MLLEGISRLQSRYFYFWYAEGKRAKLLRSADTPLNLWKSLANSHSDLRQRVLLGCLPEANPRTKQTIPTKNPMTNQAETRLTKMDGANNSGLPDDFEELG